MISYLFQEIKARVNIQEVADHYLPGLEFRRSGRNLIALCPFHQEKTPSFTVNLERQVFYCFGCGAGGDAIQLVALALGVRPGEAARQIAADFGIPLPGRETSPEVRRRAREAEQDRQIERAFLRWLERTHRDLCLVYRAVDRVLANDPADSAYEAACHLQPYIGYLLDVLDYGSDQEKIEFFASTGW